MPRPEILTCWESEKVIELFMQIFSKIVHYEREKQVEKLSITAKKLRP